MYSVAVNMRILKIKAFHMVQMLYVQIQTNIQILLHSLISISKWTVSICVWTNQTSKDVDKSCSHTRNTQQTADSDSNSDSNPKTLNLHKIKSRKNIALWLVCIAHYSQFTAHGCYLVNKIYKYTSIFIVIFYGQLFCFMRITKRMMPLLANVE